MMSDIRDRIFESLVGRDFKATVFVEEPGILAGMPGALIEAEAVGCTPHALAKDGDPLNAGEAILHLQGSPIQLAKAEETVMGALAKPSGIASATRQLVDRAGKRLRIVGGGWKKMPGTLKEMVREAARIGGAEPRIDDPPFLYLDKNYVRLLGGIEKTLDAAAPLCGYRRVVQIGSGALPLEEETRIAVGKGVSTLFVDTGDICDLKVVIRTLAELGARDQIKLAFGGGVTLQEVDGLAELGVNALCIGRAIVDAPLLSFRMEVLTSEDGLAAGPIAQQPGGTDNA
jgi:nicotinate-nucleotide pyrophosphorylase (carboxylating)